MADNNPIEAELKAAGIAARMAVLTQEINLMRLDLNAEDWLQVQRRALYVETHMKWIKDAAKEYADAARK